MFPTIVHSNPLPTLTRAARLAATLAVAVLLATPALAAPAVSAPAVAAPLPLQAVCDVHFTGSSTLHDFHGSAPAVTVPLQPGTLDGHWTAEAGVDVRSLDTGNGSRDSNMWNMFDAKNWPSIRASFADIDAAAIATGKRLSFKLTIREITHDVVATVTSWQQDQDKVAFNAAFDVSLTAFGLEAPSVLGLVHVADSVAVGVHVIVTKAAAGS